jgi:hypothetical protein
MIVRFLQAGGYAGLLRGCDLDTATLVPEQAKKLEQLLNQSGISASGEFRSASSRDLGEYELTIEDKGSTIRVVFDDETIPEAAKPLIGFLKKCSKPKVL